MMSSSTSNVNLVINIDVDDHVETSESFEAQYFKKEKVGCAS